MNHRKSPCSTCPWRKDVKSEFPPRRFRALAHTAYDMARGIFACHFSADDNPAACAGFLLRGATHNLSVRLALSEERIDPREISDGGHELHESYRAMAVANGVRKNDPALRECRSNYE